MHIRKILTYDVYANTVGAARYQHVVKLLNQSIDPDTLLTDSLDCGKQAVLTSPLKRAVQCIKRDSALSITASPQLTEIAFPLQEYCTENDFLEYGSVAVRKAFVQAFIEDKLCVPHKQLKKELEDILILRGQAKPPLCISHTFRMKLLEIYASIGDDLFRNPSLLGTYVSPEKHLYEFGEIIEVRI